MSEKPRYCVSGTSVMDETTGTIHTTFAKGRFPGRIAKAEALASKLNAAMTTPPPPDPAEAMCDEDIGPTPADVIVESLPPKVHMLGHDPHVIMRLIIANLTEAGFEICRRDAAAGTVCVSREDLEHVVRNHRYLPMTGSLTREEFLALDDRLRAALGEGTE